MPAIAPTRNEVTDRFSVVGFRIQTGGDPLFEVAVSPDWKLFLPEHKGERTHSNFYSSRAEGPLPAERGETVYLLPAAVLQRFVGRQKLYYAVATFADRSRTKPGLVRAPTEQSPWISLEAFTGRPSRRTIIGYSRSGISTPGVRYGESNSDELEWAGDIAQPGHQAIPPKEKSPSPPIASIPNLPATKPTASETGYDAPFEYDDGFGPMPPEVEDSADDAGIDFAIPDDVLTAAEMAIASAQDTTQPEYPRASRFAPAAPGNYRASTAPRAIRRIVIHITDGTSTRGAVGWFQNPNQQVRMRDGTLKHVTVSAHYVIGQDGEVVQMVKHNDVAWHASQANGDSIGIEHVARFASPRLEPSEAQYCASAALVNWLCEQNGIPKDRAHILGHNEASPRDNHPCPTTMWDWDYYMDMVTTGTCRPRTATTSSALSYDLYYDVPLIPQPDKLSCWASSMAMLLSFRRNATVTPESLAQEVGRDLRTSYTWDMLEAVKSQFGFHDIELPSNASLYPPPEQWQNWLSSYGPLWVTTIGAPSHAIIINGIAGDLTPEGTTMSVLNPWDTTKHFDNDPIEFNPPNYGSRYKRSFQDFSADFGLLGLDNYGHWRVLYLPPAQTQSLGRHVGASHGNATRRVKALTAGESFDLNWKAKALSGEPLVPGDVIKVGGKTYVIYADEIRSGGVWAWVNNNPGNITKSSEAERYGAFVGKGNGGFAIFPDYEIGFNAIISFLRARQEKNIAQIMSIYAPADDGKNPMLKGNDPEAYARSIAQRLGVPVTTKISDLSDEQLQKFADQIERIETGPSGSGTVYAYNDPSLPNEIRDRLPAERTTSKEEVPLVTQGMAESDRKVRHSAYSAAAETEKEIPTLGLKEVGYSEEIGDASTSEEQGPEAIEEVVLTNEEIYRIIREVAMAHSGDELYSAVSADREFTTAGQEAYQRRHFGLCFGLVLFPQETGRLGKVLELMHRRDPATFAQIFGANSDALLATTNASTSEERLQLVGGEPLWSQGWIDRFRRAGQVPAFQNAQNEEAIEGQFRQMLKIAAGLGLRSDRALAMAYDRVVTRGFGGGMSWLVRVAGSLRTETQRRHALQTLGYNEVAEFQDASGIPQDGVFGPETYAALTGALRREGIVPLPSSADLVCRMVAAVTGPVKDRLVRLRDSTRLNDKVYAIP